MAGAFPLSSLTTMRLALLTILFACAVATEATAKVAQISFEQLVWSSDLIIVAKVESVGPQLNGKRYANAKVTENWKGPPTGRVEFLASPTWTCDISQATEGETVLLFLAKENASRGYLIAHSGHGRMPLRSLGRKSYVKFSPMVQLPKGTPTINGPGSVEIELLRGLVNQAGQNRPLR